MSKKKEIVDQGGRGRQSSVSYFLQCLGDIDILHTFLHTFFYCIEFLPAYIITLIPKVLRNERVGYQFDQYNIIPWNPYSQLVIVSSNQCFSSFLLEGEGGVWQK